MQELLYQMSSYTSWERGEEATWIIWGIGNRGLALLKYLKRLKISNIYFADNDFKKVGSVTDGVKCISRSEVETMADRSIILVSPYRNKGLYDDLRRDFPYVIPDIVLEILEHWPQANGFDKIYKLGHHYSLYPNMVELEQRKDILYSINKEVKDIDFHVDKQYSVLEKMKELLPSIPQWSDRSQCANSIYRYRTDTQAFCVPDATCLHLMLRILQPKRLIEVGSGWSSAVTLDTNELVLVNNCVGIAS